MPHFATLEAFGRLDNDVSSSNSLPSTPQLAERQDYGSPVEPYPSSTPTESAPLPSSTDLSKLSVGAIAGISVGAVLLISAVVILVLLVRQRRRRLQPPPAQFLEMKGGQKNQVRYMPQGRSGKRSKYPEITPFPYNPAHVV